MAQEPNEGVAYLTALKQTTGAAAAGSALESASPQSAGAMTAGATPRYQGAEKRRSPRYKCDGSVELSEDGTDVHTWARFTDVSLHGCYVEAQATYPVGTRVDMKMELNGLRVESKGNVRVTYPYLGMGIAFVDMSEENRDKLKSLLSTVTYSRIIVGPGVTTTVPTAGPMDAGPQVSNPGAAMQALVEFFKSRHMLTREEFLNVVARSQRSDAKR